MKLIIAEKPSLAKEIANFIGIRNKKSSYFDCEKNYFVTWLYGHVLELKNPKEYDEKWEKWSLKTLPIIPQEFTLKPKKETKKQFLEVKKLIAEATEIINAGDPDREGQLLVDEVIEFCKVKKKSIKRILLNALDKKSIEEAFNTIQPNENFIHLMESAKARSIADWLVGLNLTRAFTLYAQQKKLLPYDTLFSVGRVQTPTLNIITKRYLENKNFISKDFYELYIFFQKQNKIFDLKYNKNNEEDEENKILKKDYLENIIKAIANKKGVVKNVKTSKKTNLPPLGFSLSKLQAEANKRFSYSADTILKIAQKLYEKGMTTYPRTDCVYLAENQFKEAEEIIQKLKKLNFVKKYQFNATKKSAIWNTEKVSSHHAIIPTGETHYVEQFSKEEKNIYELIVNQYLVQFLSEAIYEETEIIVNILEHHFKGTFKKYLQKGFLDFNENNEENKNIEENIKDFPILVIGENIEQNKTEIKNKKTSSPKLYTEGTLISAMANSHLLLEELGYKGNQLKELQQTLKNSKGIGTEATRAEIIKKLKERNFVEIKNKNIVPTQTGMNIISILENKIFNEKFEYITNPAMTSIYEQKFEDIVEKKISINTFLSEIKNNLTKNLNGFNDLSLQLKINTMENQTTQKNICPKCKNGTIYFNEKSAFCSNWNAEKEEEKCNFSIWRVVAEKKLSNGDFEDLLTKGETNKIEGFISKKTGKPFSAILKMKEDFKTEFVF